MHNNSSYSLSATPGRTHRHPASGEQPRGELGSTPGRQTAQSLRRLASGAGGPLPHRPHTLPRPISETSVRARFASSAAVTCMQAARPPTDQRRARQDWALRRGGHSELRAVKQRLRQGGSLSCHHPAPPPLSSPSAPLRLGRLWTLCPGPCRQLDCACPSMGRPAVPILPCPSSTRFLSFGFSFFSYIRKIMCMNNKMAINMYQ